MSGENEIVLWKLKDLKTGAMMDLRTAFIEREKLVPMRVNVPLYIEGELLADAELAALDIEKVGFTQEQLDAEHYANLYTANPRLADRVRQYRDFLDGLELDYAVTTDAIEAAIQARTDLDATGKLELASRIRTAFQDIVVNLEAVGCETANFEAWAEMRNLIKYLPTVEAGE